MTQNSPTLAIDSEFQHSRVTPSAFAAFVDDVVDSIDRHGDAPFVSENVS